MKTHTPGPWSVFEPKSPFVCYEGGDSPAAIVSGGVHIATMPGLRTSGLSETARANARLIASAPDLLASLIELESMVAEMLPKHGPCGWGELALNQAREAIAKARASQ